MIALIKGCVKGVGLGMSGSGVWDGLVTKEPQEAFTVLVIAHDAPLYRARLPSCGFPKTATAAIAREQGAE